MKDPSHELIGALFTAINGNVSYGGDTIPTYTRVIEWDDRPADQWIRIAEVAYDEDGAKDTFVPKGTVDIFVDTFFTGKNEGSKVPMNNIANQVSQLIGARDQILSLSGFTMIMGRVESMEDFDYILDPQGAVFEKLITYQFIIQQD